MVTTGDFPSSDIHHCSHQCQDNPIINDDVNQAYVINQLCFSSNEILPFQSRDFIESPCDVVNSTCPSQLIGRDNFTRASDVDFELIFPDVIKTFEEFEILLLTNEGND